MDSKALYNKNIGLNNITKKFAKLITNTIMIVQHFIKQFIYQNIIYHLITPLLVEKIVHIHQLNNQKDQEITVIVDEVNNLLSKRFF